MIYMCTYLHTYIIHTYKRIDIQTDCSPEKERERDGQFYIQVE